jgi:hemin uptake protein HemP
MPLRISPHARARIAERGIEAEWLEAALHRPQRVVVANAGREERQSVIERDGKRMLLRIIREGDLVIAAVLTSKLDKYGV